MDSESKNNVKLGRATAIALMGSAALATLLALRNSKSTSSSANETPTSTNIPPTQPATATKDAPVVAVQPTPTESIKAIFTPEIIQNVEVYGLKEKIEKLEQIDYLYSQFDKVFDDKVPGNFKDASRWNQRKEVLPNDRRYAEFMVTRSAYENWNSENGVDYVTWVKLHVDLLNRALKNGKPPVNLKVEPSRIIVVDDDFTTNPSKYSKDIDATWFNNNAKIESGYKYRFNTNADGSVKFESVTPHIGFHKYKIDLPFENDTFASQKEGVVDCGTTHELAHQVLNMHDEYVFDSHQIPFRYKNFKFYTGYFDEPQMSPYLTSLFNKYVKDGVRGYYTDPRGFALDLNGDGNYGEIPKKITLNVQGPTEVVLSRGTFNKADYYSPQNFVAHNLTSNGNVIDLPASIFEPQFIDAKKIYPISFVLDLKSNEETRELHIPVAAFNLAKFKGVEDANYTIEFLGDANIPSDGQVVEVVDDSDLAEFFDGKTRSNEIPYAKMKIDGTDTWFVWFQKNNPFF